MLFKINGKSKTPVAQVFSAPKATKQILKVRSLCGETDLGSGNKCD
jgi:hypothetical protein